MSSLKKLKEEYRASLKSQDTEEGIDLIFYRPIGFAWARLAARVGVTPNVITIASIFLGTGAAVAFFFPNLWINIAGMLLLIWANSFDSADGQLARLTGQYSRLGRILDGVAGDIWFFSIYLAICLRMNTFVPWFVAHPWVIWTVAALAGICHAKQASMADYYRQFHLFFLKGRDGSELDSTRALLQKYRELSWKHDFGRKLVMTFYLNYTLDQERWTPGMQRLRRAIMDRWPDGQIPASFREAFRRASLPLMKYTNILSFNWRAITLFVSLFIGRPWLYFVVELTVFNALLLYMVLRHESICRRFTRQLTQYS